MSDSAGMNATTPNHGSDDLPSIRRFLAYPAYRDSGVPWLERVPVEWSVARLKHALAKIGSGGTPDTANADYWSDRDNGTPWITIGDMSSTDHVTKTKKQITDLAIAEKRLTIWPSGTLLFSMYASLGHVARIGVPATINEAILALVPNERIDQDFLKRWLEFLQPRLREYANSNTQDNLNAEKVKKLPCVFPPLHEQRAIAAFLDRECGKMDALVAEQERLIALLKKKRQAVISHAVTKGLDPTAPMKDSGVPWLEQVPSHWTITPLKRVISFRIGWTPPTNRDDLYDGIHPWATIADMSGRVIFKTGKSISNEAVRLAGIAPSPKGSLLFSFKLSVGQVCFAGTDIFTNEAIATFEPSYNVNLLFAYYAFPIFLVKNAFENIYGAKILNQDLMRNALLTLPPPSEQDAIAAFLDSECSRIDALIAESETMISLLLERRSALISAAVTGQIDVRTLSGAS